ncbi:DNA-binding transcriptional regulator, PadR family [Amycolatopsis arida]|uniref:DNA-binding transcriptional regulator, PadR family n=1 Tax=Amycolatopsis arida TaxID=587909 RepID=A0A1I5M2W4_9PSEU|nr:PadR family transcriptional regulator [Amycolatopsis arida]TDX93950.1 DNA-binding PadR family transcriptional regulator [Amycolatopsis arida]SFP03944.1 DNA-binding transcriptional regulator, PadR family [Amycolatopsis arida]
MAPKRKISNTLALAVLGLLLERPMHPYEMAAVLRERHKGSSFKINSGSLYDTVEALVRHGWIEPKATVRSGRRPERTVYTHTELGHREFLRWLDELVRVPVDEYPKFLAAVSYLGALGPGGAVDALTERTHHLTRWIEETRAAHAEVVDSGAAPRLFVIEVEYLLNAWESELAWVRRTIDEIRDGSLAWPDTPPDDRTDSADDATKESQ